MTRYARKVDTNHAELRDQLRAIPGVKVLDTASMSGLGCDLLVFYQDTPPLMVEVKAGAKQPLTDSERRLKGLAGRYWIRATGLEDVLRALGISGDPAPGEW